MATETPKYEQLYRMGRFVCGAPCQQFVDFFDAFDRRGCRVLDLGCGQGRDALFIARKGHSVLGVDLSATGIRQMLEDAAEEGLDVAGVVADVVEFQPDGEYDVILLDRVLHMLSDSKARIAVLETVCRHTRPGGYVLLADTPRNMGALIAFFGDKKDEWEKHLEEKGCLITQRKDV